jgi:hypothetical protein
LEFTYLHEEWHSYYACLDPPATPDEEQSPQDVQAAQTQRTTIMTVYYNIFQTKTHVEYHLSSDRNSVVMKKALSSRVKRSHPYGAELILEWFNSARIHDMERVGPFT